MKKHFILSVAGLILLNCASTISTAVERKPISTQLAPINNLALTQKQLKDWQHLDITTDSVPGISWHKAQKEFLKKHNNDIVVAVSFP